MADHLCDYLPEDSEADDSHDTAINALIEQVAPKVYIGGGSFFEFEYKPDGGDPE